MRLSKMFALIIGLIVLQSSMSQSAQAQSELDKFRMDYSKPLIYQPSDPWQRGKIFNTHTGNAGRYYNCDGEQEKRNSPYIGWKEHTDCDFVPKKKFFDCIADDLAEVRQRVKDGAGACYEPKQFSLPTWNCSSCGTCRQSCRCAKFRPIRSVAGPCTAGGCGDSSCSDCCKVPREIPSRRQMYSQTPDTKVAPCDTCEKESVIARLFIPNKSTPMMATQPRSIIPSQHRTRSNSGAMQSNVPTTARATEGLLDPDRFVKKRR